MNTCKCTRDFILKDDLKVSQRVVSMHADLALYIHLNYLYDESV